MNSIRILVLSLGLLLAWPSHAEWGRLFYTPAERAALDRGAQPGEAVTPATRRFDGEVRRSSGRILRWVDGQPGEPRPPKQVKPGERWNPATGKIYPTGRGPETE